MSVVKQQSTRFSIVKRSKGQSAVEKASYISRSVLVSEYDGMTYQPKYHEDLIHSEIILPESAPADYKDRAALWNSVEMAEKGKKAQLARMLKATLPNDWDKETAIETVRDYVQRNFVSRGMCADFAIHDSVNPEGQHNLHFHLLLTMRAIDEEGRWLPKQRKVYLLDENGDKIPNKNGKGFKYTTEKTTDWDEQGNAKLWRKDLTDTINAVNERIGLDEHWEHRSFKEQGLDILPTIHLGARASALERKGIRTEKGDYNRMVLEQRSIFQKAKDAFISAANALRAAKDAMLKSGKTEKLPMPVPEKKNEVLEFIERVISEKGRILCPETYGLWRKLPDEVVRRMVTLEYLKSFLKTNRIDSFDSLSRFSNEAYGEYSKSTSQRNDDERRLDHLESLVSAYKTFRPYEKAMEKSKELTGWEKKKHDFSNRHLLGENYKRAEEDMRRWMFRTETEIDGKGWKKELKLLRETVQTRSREIPNQRLKAAIAEVLLFNRREEERVKMIEQRERDRAQQKQTRHTQEQTPKKKRRGMEI